MATDRDRQKRLYELHQRAKKIVSQRPEDLLKTPATEFHQLIHDLEVQLIESQLRNEELTSIQTKLEASRKECIDLFDFAPIGYFNLDSQGVIINANITGADMLRISRPHLLKMHFAGFIEPQHQELFSKYLQETTQIGSRQDCEVKIHRQDGTIFDARLQTVAIYSDSRPLYRVSVIDITDTKQMENALRESEGRFRNIFESSPIGIEIYDAEGKLVTLNRACLQIFGVSDAASVRGFRLFNDPNVTDEVKERLRRGETVRWEAPFNFELVKEYKLYKTGRSGIIYLDVLVTPLVISQDSPPGYLVQLQDITGRYQLERDLKQQASSKST